MKKLIKILLVEDDQDDVDLLKEAFEDNNIEYTMDLIKDGGLVERYIQECITFPDVIVLDFNLPKVHGRDLLKLIKNTPSFQHIPVFVLTTSSAQKDIDYAYKEGAKKYLIKPTTIQGINQVIAAITSGL